MATLTAFQPIDMTQIDLNLIATAATNYSAATNITYDGITYGSAVEIDWNYNGQYYASVFAGNNITYTDTDGVYTITGGTVTGYFQLEYLSGDYTPQFVIQHTSYSAVDLYNAALTVDPTDDLAAFSAILGGHDTILGSPGNDVLAGFGASETFAGNGGSDVIYGGSGLNTATYTGTVEQYVIDNSSGPVTIADSIVGRDGSDTLYNIQQAQFSDVTVVFDLHSSQDLTVYELYQAAYARMPDLAGFRYWANVADVNNTSAVGLADAFLAAAEFTQKYGANPDTTTYITELYTNVLGRTPDQAGLDYWIGVANAGDPRDQLLVAFAGSAENQTLVAPHTAHGYWTS